MLLSLVAGICIAEKVNETEPTTDQVLASKESEDAAPAAAAEERSDSVAAAAESRVIAHASDFNALPVYNGNGLKQNPIMAPYPVYRHQQPIRGPPQYRGPPHGSPQFRQPPFAGIRYQPQNPAGNNVNTAKSTPQTAPQVPVKVIAEEITKEESKKKPIHKPKPQYYPKESTYAVVPEQPVPNTARFVPDQTRNQVIETISPAEMHKLAIQPQRFPVHPHGLHMPHYPGPLGPQRPGPFVHVMKFNEQGGQQKDTDVHFEETEHGFMDRMWGEISTVRRTMSDNIFVGIPSMFRRFWDSIVGTVSATARMFTVEGPEALSDVTASMTDVTSRMVNNVDWHEVFRLLYSQFST